MKNRMWNMNNFNKSPEILINKSNESVCKGYKNIIAKITKEIIKVSKEKVIIAIECYPGVDVDEILNGLILPLRASGVYCTDDLYYSAHKVTEMLQYNITSDRVFGIYAHHTYDDFFCKKRLENAREEIIDKFEGLVVVYGVGASLVTKADMLIYADL